MQERRIIEHQKSIIDAVGTDFQQVVERRSAVLAEWHAERTRVEKELAAELAQARKPMAKLETARGTVAKALSRFGQEREAQMRAFPVPKPSERSFGGSRAHERMVGAIKIAAEMAGKLTTAPQGSSFATGCAITCVVGAGLVAAFVILASDEPSLVILPLVICPLFLLLLSRDYSAPLRWYKEFLQQAADAEADLAAIEQELREDRTTELAELQDRFQALVEEAEQEMERLAPLAPACARLTERAGAATEDWGTPAWQNGHPGALAEPVCRLGLMELPLISSPLRMPLLAPLPAGSLLIRAAGEQKSAAIGAVQSAVLRLLATVPAGKLHLTLIDPVGLGQNVAPFLHLSDYDESLVGGKAWIEPQHIEQRLADLTEHAEMVIHKYLRQRYPDIESYNREAGEIAEPYRLLVVIGFPVNWTENACRRLISLAQNGPRCGVGCVVVLDTDKPLPHGVTDSDLQVFQRTLLWDADARGFVLEPKAERCWKLTLDTPPDPAMTERLLDEVGKAAQEGKRVEVPFGRIAPPPERWWTGDATESLRVPLGPAGAHRTLHLELGRAMAQHALLVGRPGSGKSTLVHVMITGLALTYSPDEVCLYLIDFKKGVEFKTYAAHALPHARVVAIEGEREFGLSVLKGLEAEFDRRGDAFRNAGVDDIAAFRRRTGRQLPRILLVVDEFQVFFAEDDAIAAQAQRVLDHLVRQGRAFGIHLLLATQTLSAAQTLFRSTLDQMAVRIALQCSDADSRLVLAEDNPAARLLSRPGEAIYNAGAGLVEHNDRFQVAWLPDEEQAACLERVRAKFGRDGEGPVVFEGNAPAELTRCRPLQRALAAAPAPARAYPVWLGEPLTLEGPVAARLSRQSGSNVLIVGHDDATALGQMVAAVAALTAQTPPPSAGPQFRLLNFGAVDTEQAELLPYLAERMAPRLKVGGRRALAEMLQETAEEVDRRAAAGTGREPPVCLIIYGLQRARDLQPENSYGAPESGSPAHLLQNILCNGPEVGVHTLVWCDTVNNLQRVMERRLLREFELRVAFQMSPEDSAQLLDTPDASRLGKHRALLYAEAEGTLTRFRPYGAPSLDWMVSTLRLPTGV